MSPHRHERPRRPSDDIEDRRDRRDARIRADRVEIAMAELEDRPPTDDIEFGPDRDTRTWRGGSPGLGRRRR
ncbi:hypothetical protein AB0B20_04295 [Micromonospora sp. NPDC049151]|uniref:hypothetical protein n=1 Tax=Micromonospora sp. NPDC049151 TaxID=3155648 RepID=UPI00340C601E